MLALPRHGRLRPRRLPLLPFGLAAIAGAWLVVLGAHAAGRGGWFGHEAPNLLAWQVMVVAMMGPSALPMTRYVAANTLVPGRALSVFAIGYLGAWTAFLCLFGAVDAALHVLVGSAPAGSAGPALAFGFAAAWQVTPYKRRALRACRAVWVLPAHRGRAEPAALRLGLRQGAACVTSCGPLMLAAMAAPHGRVGLMASAAALVWAEKSARQEPATTWSAAALLVAAVGVAATV